MVTPYEPPPDYPMQDEDHRSYRTPVTVSQRSHSTDVHLRHNANYTTNIELYDNETDRFQQRRQSHVDKHSFLRVTWITYVTVPTRLEYTRNRAPSSVSLIAGNYYTSGDSDGEVRDASYQALGSIMRIVGEKVATTMFEGVDKSKMEKIKEICDAAIKEVGPAEAKKAPPPKAPEAKPVVRPGVELIFHRWHPDERYVDPLVPIDMLRTRQFPEIAGIYLNDEQPSLRRFTKYTPGSTTVMTAPSQPNMFTKSAKKPLFFMGNWTFRDKKTSRPTLNDKFVREDRPQSMNFSDLRSSRSRSETNHLEFPRNSELRIPVRAERGSIMRKSSNAASKSTTSTSTTPTETPSTEYRTNIAIEDVAVMRPKKEELERNNNNDTVSFQDSAQIRRSCPDLDVSCITNLENHRISKKRNRRAKEKMANAAWRRKEVKDWTLDDVLLWLQSCQLDEVASLLIGYDLRGKDLLQWDHVNLRQLGVLEESTRTKILEELAAIQKQGPVEEKEKHKTLFDIVKSSTYDQVLAVETPLTTRDISVTHGRLGCLQITKVNGANLPLREQDCLLEINERSGEHFKSALMLTKLISELNGTPIRFVILRRKVEDTYDEPYNERSSSGISSSPNTPTE